MQNIQKYVRRSYRKLTYRIGENGCAVFSNTQKEAENFSWGVKDYVDKEYGREGVIVNYTILSGSRKEDTHKITSKIYGFCSEMNNRMAYFDFLTGVRNRNSFEKEWNRLQRDKENQYYIIADLNNLKTVNDTLGHSAGDELLRSFAKMITEVAGDNGMVFRQGGDEFSLLWKGEDITAFLEELEKKRENVNRERVIEISYAIGYSRVLEKDSLKKADQMMYTMKKTMKKQ